MITLFGKGTTLNDIEHGFIRGDKKHVGSRNNFNEPRIHFAVNCASIGCPALLNEPFTAAKMEQQLETATKNFLMDSSRNNFNVKTKTWEHSSIFKWYKGDFEKGHKGHTSLKKFVQNYVDAATTNPAAKAIINSGNFKTKPHPDGYNWNLNDKI